MIQSNAFMENLIEIYRRQLNLPDAIFTRIDHEDGMVATVFKISQTGTPDLILKICSRKEDFLRESYFLNRFAGKIPVPRVIQLEPQAILMECVEGSLLKSDAISNDLAKELGALLAHIHLEIPEDYGNLIDTFTLKFEEGLEECKGHLPEKLMETCRQLFDKDIDLLLTADGPCIIHRDFRPGNILAASGKVQAIIDWSSARAGFAEEDFCLLEMGEWPDSCKASFLKGYASIRKVPHYNPLLPLLTLSRAIASVGFTVKRGTWNSKNSKFYQRNRKILERLILK